MHPPTVRVVYDNRPYLVVTRDDGSMAHAYGPFVPGTEPSLDECGEHNEVSNGVTLGALSKLVPISPSLRPAEDTLAGDR